MQVGKTPHAPLPWPPASDAKTSADGGPTDLFHLALGWLKEDRVLRKEKEERMGRVRGPKPEVSAAFYFLQNGYFPSLDGRRV